MLENSTPRLRRAKRVAARDGQILRALVEQGLAQMLAQRVAKKQAVPPLPVVRSFSLSPEAATGS